MLNLTGASSSADLDMFGFGASAPIAAKHPPAAKKRPEKPKQQTSTAIPSMTTSANGEKADTASFGHGIAQKPNVSKAPAPSAGRSNAGATAADKAKSRVPLFYPPAQAATDGAHPTASTADRHPDMVAAKQAAARAAIREALGVDDRIESAPIAQPSSSVLVPASAANESSIKELKITGPHNEVKSRGALPNHPVLASVSAAEPISVAPSSSSAFIASSIAKQPDTSTSSNSAAAAAIRLLPPGPDDDTTAWLSCDDFRELKLEPRLTAKLTAAKQGGAAALGAVEDASGTAVTRGHTRDGFGLSRPTRVQRLFIPPALAGRSLCAKSETGSGKTLAFLVPIVNKLLAEETARPGSLSRSSGLFSIILAPTRELCQQIFTVASRLLQPFPFIVPGLVAGGEKRKAEKARLRKGVSLLVATPGRLCDHLRTTAALGSSALTSLRWLVLDEADRLLDLGFGPQIAEVVASLRSSRASWRTYLLSATLSSRVRTLAAGVLAEGDTATLLDATALVGTGGGGGGGGLLEDEDEDEDEEAKAEGGAKGQDGSKATKAASSSSSAAAAKGGPRDMVTPTRLTQQYVVGALKWRLPTLLALLVDAVALARKGRRANAAAASAASSEGVSSSSGGGGGAKIIVFMSTCDTVDLHFALFGMLLPHMLAAGGAGGQQQQRGHHQGPIVRVSRLHGDMPQAQRTTSLRAFASDAQGVSLLVTTDVAARGLDLPQVDVIVQADPPSDTQDYVHRVGRTARAGQAGRAVLLLQPHERPYVELLAAAGLTLHPADVTPMFAALARCPVPSQLLESGPASAAAGGSGSGSKEGPGRAGSAATGRKGVPAASGAGRKRKRAESTGDSDSSDSGGEGDDTGNKKEAAVASSDADNTTASATGGSGPISSYSRKLASLMEAAERSRQAHKGGATASASNSSSSGSSTRWAELQAVMWQTLIEGIVATHASPLPAAGSGSGSPPEPLVDLARRAFASFVRAYATHEKACRHIFHPRALHLGHAAKACGLTEQPTQVVARSSKAAAKRARLEDRTAAGGGGAAASAASSAAAGGGGGSQRKAEGRGARALAAQPSPAKPSAAAAAASSVPHQVRGDGHKRNRLSFKATSSAAGGAGGGDDREEGDHGGPQAAGVSIKQQLLSKARKVQSKKATMSEFEA